MKKVLIVGGHGALGQTITELYVAAGHDVTSIDRDELDITDETAVQTTFTQLKPELVFNCAAFNDLDGAEADDTLAKLINGTAVGYLAKAAKGIGATMVHFSTNYVFDGENENGYSETDTPSPKSKYAESKLLGEKELQANTENFFLIRTAWLYGREALVGGKKSFVQIMLDLAKDKTSLNLVEDEYGHPTYVPDLARATMELVESNAPFGIYHITNSGSTNWLGWAEEIFKIRGIEMELKPVPGSEFKRPAARPHWGILHNNKQQTLRPWQEALRDYLQTLN